MASNEEKETFSLQDAFRDLDDEQNEAIAVLGACDDNNCTYDMGYMDRQAIFSCLTCNLMNDNVTGFCYACSLHCHNGHDLVVLYTKRRFRCDCGNDLYKDFSCSLEKNKGAANKENKYNHNFKGAYCTCERPYPDPEDEVEDEMIQCIICEDWFHSRHLGALSPSEFSEMTCDSCIKKNSFLQYYKEYSVQPSTDISRPKLQDINTSINVDRTLDNDMESKSNEICLLNRLKSVSAAMKETELKVMFWQDGWRNRLCQCKACLELYTEHDIAYITDEGDTIQSYEKKGDANVKKVFEDAASHVSQMNHVQQMHLIQGYNDLKSGLSDFLSSFKENQVVRKEDIETFFEGLNSRKRRRLEEGYGIPPDNCRT